MSQKLLTVLGTGKYSPCKYSYLNSQSCETKYIQEALVDVLTKNKITIDEIIVFLTPEARARHWINENDESSCLKLILESYDKIRIIEKDIPNGKNQDEIWQIYQTIYDSIDTDDNIKFDITHSFRSLPMLALVVLNFARVTKDIKIDGIFYGAFEAATLHGIDKIAPIFDLNTYNEIMQWTSAFNSFIKYGNSNEINEVASKLLYERLKNKEQEAMNVNRFIKALHNFTGCINDCRGKRTGDTEKSNKSIEYAYEDMEEKLGTLLESNNGVVKIIAELLEKVKDKTSGFKKKYKNHNLSTGIAVIGWSIENNLTQQAYTAFEETLKTYICVKYNLDETDYVNRENIASTVIVILAQKIPETDWKIDKEKIDKVKGIVNDIKGNQNTADLIAKIASRIKDYRNDINHFGYTKTVLDYNKLDREIRVLFEAFKELLSNDKSVQSD